MTRSTLNSRNVSSSNPCRLLAWAILAASSSSRVQTSGPPGKRLTKLTQYSTSTHRVLEARNRVNAPFTAQNESKSLVNSHPATRIPTKEPGSTKNSSTTTIRLLGQATIQCCKSDSLTLPSAHSLTPVLLPLVPILQDVHQASRKGSVDGCVHLPTGLLGLG